LNYEPENVVEISLLEAIAPISFHSGKWTENVISRIREGVDAWMCSSSVAAETLCHCLQDRRFRIPQDVAVTGYHRNTNQPANLPPITSTDVADEDLGAAALRRLLHRFGHPDESQRSILLPVRFAEGETTRRPSLQPRRK